MNKNLVIIRDWLAAVDFPIRQLRPGVGRQVFGAANFRFFLNQSLLSTEKK